MYERISALNNFWLKKLCIVRPANWNTFGTEKNCSIYSAVVIYQSPSNVSLWDRLDESVRFTSVPIGKFWYIKRTT